ncbi:hypothetical protein SH1V18_42160 [Vallitalea longa]|uniref:Uncharacterized protein n=1 Tax=Vallitalea longa TaxID=2936439 RepID=A0A9W5YFD5_9FIRM|nr:hypothetical protein [Vallitalea longa]GKX31736.1 hypothetical protein SH1V18_42160 [Vallitalea longa]
MKSKNIRLIFGFIFFIIGGVIYEFERYLYVLIWRTRSDALINLGDGPANFAPIFSNIVDFRTSPSVGDNKIAIAFFIIGIVLIISSFFGERHKIK